MRSTKKSTFTSPTFSSHLKTLFEGLYERETYSDVTLVCDDKIQYKVHKIVLSFWSQVFKEIIDNNPSTNPLIYLRGIQHEEMDSILQFMYLGEGTFCQEKRELVLKVAQDLEIKEIVFSDSNVKEAFTLEEKNDIEYYEENEEDKLKEIKAEPVEQNIQSDEMTDDSNISVVSLKKEQSTDDGLQLEEDKEQTLLDKTSVEEDTNTQDVKIKTEKDPECPTSTTTTREKFSPKNPAESNYRCPECRVTFDRKKGLIRHCRAEHGGLYFPCSLCEFKTSKRPRLRVHMESQHRGVTYLCSQCGVQCRTQNQLSTHTRTKHGDGGPKFTCSHCGFTFSRLINLTTHVKSRHEGLKFPCRQCEKEFTYERGLKIHLQSVHEGVKIPCPDCEYEASTKGNLDIHIKTIHQGVRFQCKQCDYKASRQYYVKRHVKMKHTA